ncbi:MAG: nucleotide exchange factor GrpE [Rickettsiaceae bacterium]|nr:nucleotide exchange factor GrpE [Rickettsiaceae bacterium]
MHKPQETTHENQQTNSAEITETQIEHQVNELNDRLLRSIAENENMRKRFEKQLEEASSYSVTNFAKDLISVIDNLDRAIQFKPEGLSPEMEQFFDGVLMTHKELCRVFAKNNISVIAPNPGDKFDYHHHFAISQVEDASYPKDTIVGLMQVGYKIKDRLIRPASVSVAKSNS